MDETEKRKLPYNIFDLMPGAPLVSSYFNQSLNPTLKNSFAGGVSPNSFIDGAVYGILQSGNFIEGSDGWRIQPNGDVEFNDGTFRGSISASSIDIPDAVTTNSFHVDSQGNAWWGATTFGAALASVSKAGEAIFAGATMTDPIITDTLVAAEAITAGNLIVVLNDGRAAKGNSAPQFLGRIYGIALNSVSAGSNVTVQKTGAYTTSGLTAGSFYGPFSYQSTSGYGSETTTITQSTRGTATDAAVGIGQTMTTLETFFSTLQLYLTTPGGAGSYGFKIRIMQLYASEGGDFASNPLEAVATLTRVGTTATITLTGTDATANTGDYITVAGANQSAYNGTFRIASRLISGSGARFTYVMASDPGASGTGTITAQFRYTYFTYTGTLSSPNASENLYSFSFLAGDNSYKYHNVGAKIFFDFAANNAAEININYSNSSVYSGGEMWITGVPDVTKDLGFVFKERFGSGTLAIVTPTVPAGPLGDQGTVFPYPLVTNALGLARSTTKLLLGNFNRS